MAEKRHSIWKTPELLVINIDKIKQNPHDGEPEIKYATSFQIRDFNINEYIHELSPGT